MRPTGDVIELSATELRERLEAGEFPEFFDVRTPGERELASIEGARLLDAVTAAHIDSLDRSTPLVFI
jgi:rhodanese-related sulfurtransferase